MQEYLFNKEELRRLIEGSAGNLSRIAVRINLASPQETIWARAVRFEAGKTTESTPTDGTISIESTAPTSDREVPGCPNPPGC